MPGESLLMIYRWRGQKGAPALLARSPGVIVWQHGPWREANWSCRT